MDCYDTILQFDLDNSAPPEQAWRRRLNSHANILKEFSVTFREAIKMVIFVVISISFLSKHALSFWCFTSISWPFGADCLKVL